MKTITFQQSILITGVIILTTVSIHGQELNFSIKEVAEAFKRENECHFCTQVYQFSSKVRQISNTITGLEDFKPKKKRKKVRRLYKALDAFMENAALEHDGLADQLAYSKSDDIENIIISLIKLKGYSQQIVRLFEKSSTLSNEQTLQTSRTRILQLNEAIGNTLTTLKKQ